MALKCWNIIDAQRPTFSQIREALEECIPLSRQAEYLQLNEEYVSFNKTFGVAANNAYVDLKYETVAYEEVKY